jgi:aminopeptidase N
MCKSLLLAFILMTASIFAQTPPIEAGVSQTLAKWRAANYSDVRYKLNVTLEKGAPLMKGDIEIRVKISEAGAKNDLILDWRTTQFQNDKDNPFADVVAVNDAVEILFSVANEHITISRNLLKAGENVIKIKFASPIKTSGSAITRYVDKEDGAEYVYSLFVPSDASTAFPVFDQPDLKAKFGLTIKTPTTWKAISNGKIKSFSSAIYENFLPDKIEATTENIYVFEETQPISTYVFAFAAGEFTRFEEKSVDEKSFTINDSGNFGTQAGTSIYLRKSQAEKFKQHAAETFRLNREGVKFLESYFDYKFPFPKYDLVLIPEFPFGGMEHAGATFLREDRVIFPTEPTKNDYITRANVIFHEAAHQWFGDTVTMRWFDDLWLKEGFAEFMAYKTLEKVMPEYNAWKIFYERNKQLAYLTDSTRGTTPIYQEIPNLSAAKSAYGNIVYRKAPSFLRQAEFYLGEDKFQTAVRAFLKKHEFANAEWTDLVKEFETASKQDLKDWANVWVTERGMPVFRSAEVPPYKTIWGKLRSTGDYFLTQKPSLENSAFWKENTKVLIIYEDDSRQVKDLNVSRAFEGLQLLDGKKVQIPGEKVVQTIEVKRNLKNLVGIKNKASFVFPNYQDYGYGIFLLDERSRAYILENIQNEKDDFLRTMMWGSLWDSVREAELAPRDYVELVIKNINVETDESTIQTLLNRVSTAMNYYLSDAQSKELASQVETLLIDKMQNTPTLGQRITFYRALLNVASSEKARQTLKDILNGKFEISNFKLKTKDKFDIVTRLLILNDTDAARLLSELEKAETSDEAKRYVYAAKAGIATAENKQKFFADFIGSKEISESYIETAFVPFNSIRHSNLTLPFLEKALAELPNLKRTRKIFFINGWLAAFIGGQKSEQALAIVNKFLGDNANLDKDLRFKILEASDGLERSIKIRQKFAGK